MLSKVLKVPWRGRGPRYEASFPPLLPPRAGHSAEAQLYSRFTLAGSWERGREGEPAAAIYSGLFWGEKDKSQCR